MTIQLAGRPQVMGRPHANFNDLYMTYAHEPWFE